MHEPVMQGRSVLIDCVYDLAGGSLYSINWRFQGREFLRLLKPFAESPVAVLHHSSSSSSTPHPLHHGSKSDPRLSTSSGSRYRKTQKNSRKQWQSTTTTPAPTAVPPSPQLYMNKVFTAVPGIDVDVSPLHDFLSCLRLPPCLCARLSMQACEHSRSLTRRRVPT